MKVVNAKDGTPPAPEVAALMERIKSAGRIATENGFVWRFELTSETSWQYLDIAEPKESDGLWAAAHMWAAEPTVNGFARKAE